jgi:hypothetical protein
MRPLHTIAAIIVVLATFLPIARVTARDEATMLTVVTSPNVIPATPLPRIFLAGSIDMGSAENWQKALVASLAGEQAIVLNPRRDDWDPSWKPDLSDFHFKEQVEWELNALERADIIVMALTPDSKSPVSLLELGLYANSGRLIVFCPPGFWRKGNVDAVVSRYQVKSAASMQELVAEVRSRVRAMRMHR